MDLEVEIVELKAKIGKQDKRIAELELRVQEHVVRDIRVFGFMEKALRESRDLSYADMLKSVDHKLNRQSEIEKVIDIFLGTEF